MIKILTQGDQQILSVKGIKEVKSNNIYAILGILENDTTIKLAEYKNAYYSGKAMLYIVKEFNQDCNKIIRLPEDDKDIMNF